MYGTYYLYLALSNNFASQIIQYGANSNDFGQFKFFYRSCCK